MTVPCDCMVIYQSDGSAMCRHCRGDWYGCDCPTDHSANCTEISSPEQLADAFGVDSCEEVSDDLYDEYEQFVSHVYCGDCGEWLGINYPADFCRKCENARKPAKKHSDTCDFFHGPNDPCNAPSLAEQSRAFAAGKWVSR